MLYELDEAAQHELKILKSEELRLSRARVDAIESYGLKYYRPHPKQEAFHRAGKFKRRAVFAGNRFGKSDCGAAEDCAQALGHRPWIPEGDPTRTVGIPQRPQKILILTTDWGKVDEIFTSQRGAQTGKLWRYLPRGFVISTKANHSGALETIECANGSLIKFDTVESFKKNPQGAESSDWDVIHVDEPCPHKMYSAHARGLMDRGGQSYFTLTPLREPWIYDMFFGEADAKQIITRGAANLFKNSYWSVTGSIWDNPYLSEEAINAYLDELEDQEERECREKGIPLQFAGLIYKEFDTSLHVMSRLPEGWIDYDCPPIDWPIYLQLDPHPQTPFAGLLITVDPSGRKYIYDEIWIKGTIPTIASLIKNKTSHRQVIRMLADPSMFNEDRLTGTCWADDFLSHGLWFDRAVKDLERGIVAVKGALQSRIFDAPEWMVSPYLRRFLYEIKRWHWDKENKPIDKDDHTLECLYRAVLDKPTWVDMTKTSRPINDGPISAGLDPDERWSSSNKYDF